jgi:uncharacterized protein YceK
MKKICVVAMILVMVTLFCGCEAIINHFDGKAQYYEHKVLIHNIKNDNYLNADNKWTIEKSEAKKWLYYEALRWLEDFQKNDSNATNYLIKIEA